MAKKTEGLTLALDQGGHASRALVFDHSGREVARSMVEVATYHDGNRVEQDPEALVASLRQAAEEAVANAGPIRAAGLATQRSSIVCWDRNSGEALTPVLSWQDRRAGKRLEPLRSKAELIANLTGLRLSPHYGASKLAWCLDEVPAVRNALTRKRLLAGPLAAFLMFRLLSEKPVLTDPANASRTLLYDRHRHEWSDDLLGLFGVPREILPELSRSRHAFGHLPAGERSIPLTVCIGDQSAALFAAGTPAAGSVWINIGSGAFLQQAVKDPAAPGRLLAGLAWRGAALTVHTLEGTVNGAGSALRWLAEQRGMAPEAMEKMLPNAMAQNEEPPLFLNGVGGVGSPYWHPAFESRFIGSGDVYRHAAAIVESIVFLIVRNLEQMQAQGFVPKQIRVSGGLSRLDGLCRRLATLSGMRVERPVHVEASARGLAWLVAGRPPEWNRDSEPARFDPEPEPALERRFRRWRRAMEARLR